MSELVDEHELFKQAVDKWGRLSQIDMMIEECAELTKALCKLRRKHHPSDTAALVNDICEEIADVQIVAGQMRIVFGAEEVDDWYKEKVARLQNLLNREGKP
jgi:NTP pyrophosphatase (non-canonical NTP hydrolase)